MSLDPARADGDSRTMVPLASVRSSTGRISNANVRSMPAFRSPPAMLEPASPKPMKPIAGFRIKTELLPGRSIPGGRRVLRLLRFMAQRINDVKGHQCLQRMSARIHKGFREIADNLCSPDVDQGLGRLPCAGIQVILGSHAIEIADDSRTQCRIMTHIKKQLVQLVCGSGWMD